MKKLSSVLLTLLLVFVCTTGVFAQEGAKTINNAVNKVEAVLLNDESLNLEKHEIVTEDNVTYIPLRVLLKALDYHIKWEDMHKTVLGEKYGHQVGFQIAQDIGYSNGEETKLNAAPRLINHTTYASLESISELLGLKLEYNSQLKTVTLVRQEGKGFIWKVEKDDVDVYLLGSIHVGKNNMYPLREEIEEAYLSADKLVVEVNTSEQPSNEVLADIQALQTYTDGSKLQDHVATETYERIVGFLKEINVPANIYDNYKPWPIYLELNAIHAASIGYDSGLGIDLYFIKKAQRAIKPILELESYTSQFSIFNQYSYELQEQLVNEALDSIYGIESDEESTEPTLDVLSHLWVTGNDAELEALVAEFKENEEMYEHILKNRHPQMLQKIEGYLNNSDHETYFVIAGYLHMLGEDGLITLLKEKGYTVTRM